MSGGPAYEVKGVMRSWARCFGQYPKRYMRSWLQVPRTDWTGFVGNLGIALRFFRAWRRSLDKGRSPLSDQALWTVFEAGKAIGSLLDRDSVVFEYGAGGSTLFVSNRVKHVTSVEHDAAWFSEVRCALASQAITNCELLLVPPESGVMQHADAANPAAYFSGNEQYKHCNFRMYAAAIDSFPDNFFDLVSIDGRARLSCLWHAHAKVKVGGYLFLDDSERERYSVAKRILSNWEKREFYGPGPYRASFWQATVWRKLKA